MKPVLLLDSVVDSLHQLDTDQLNSLAILLRQDPAALTVIVTRELDARGLPRRTSSQGLPVSVGMLSIAFTSALALAIGYLTVIAITPPPAQPPAPRANGLETGS
jgi:hypothetical protein